MPMNPRLLRPLARRQAPVSSPTDPYFANVSLLLHFDTGFTDSSSLNASVTPGGDASIATTDSKFGTGSAYFDGSGDGISFSDFAIGTGDFTIEMWVKRLGSDTYAQLFGNEGSGVGFTFLINNEGTDGQLALYSTAGGIMNSGNNVCQAGQWTHVALARSAGAVRFFVDGTVASEGTDSSSYSGASNFVGTNNVYAGRDYEGYLDELRVTKGVARYTAAFTPPTAAFPNQ
jgi:hypothetical protein